MTPRSSEGILVVDDDDDIRESLLEVLEGGGYVAIGARHGQDALDKLRARVVRPCVILLDVMMPVMDGHEFRAAQRLDPMLCDMPVVVITADASAAVTASAMQADAVLRKPLSLEDLLAIAERFCGKVEPK